MKRGLQLRAERATVLDASKAIAAGDGKMTDAEKATLKANEARVNEIDAEIKQLDALAEQIRSEPSAVVAPPAAVAASPALAAVPPVAPDADAARRIVVLDNKPKGFASLGEQLLAVQHAARPGGAFDHRLMASSGLNESVPSEGGFLLQQEFASTIWERTYAVGELIKRAFRIPLSAPGSNGIKIPAVDESSRANGSRYGGVAVYWTEEGGLKTASKPTFRQLDLKLKKVAGVVYTTDELLQDSAALQAFIERILPVELQFAIEDAFVNGTGAGQPLGYMNSGAVISVTRAAANSVTWEDIVGMWARMWAPSRSSAIWLVSQDVEPQLYSMSLAIGTGGVPVYLPAGGASAAPFATLFGRPVIPCEYTAALGTTGDIQLVDMNEYVYIEKGGVQSAASMHVRFLYDEMTFRFVQRIDGMPTWNTPLTPKNGSATLSPFVVLS